ncbi:MAG: response regulator [Actinobacteria bacterium]|nr:response regulator [Actinomycetota bacterium]
MEKEDSPSLCGKNAAAPVGVVVVDDHESVRASISRIVSLQEDMTILGEAPDGRSALEVVERTRPDLVLVDIRMPEMDGLELIRILRSNYPHLRIVALSAHEDELYVSEALKHGADTYVLKGVPLKELVSTIRRVIQGRVDLPSEVTEPLINRFRLADSLLGILDQAFTAFHKEKEALEFLAASAAELCGGELYALAFRKGECFSMESGKFLGKGRPPLCDADGWALSARDLAEMAAMVEARHPVVCNEHRLRDRARGWRSPFINMVLNPVFVGEELEAIIMAASSKPFHLNAPLIRYLNLLCDQAAAFLDIVSLRRERARLESANRRLKALLRYVVGEVSGGGSLQRMTEVLVESMGLRAGALFRRESGGRWRATVRCGLTEGETEALAEDIRGSAGGGNRGEVRPWKGTGALAMDGARGDVPGVLLLPVNPDSTPAGGPEELAKLEDEVFVEASFPPYLLALVLPEAFSPEEEVDVFRSFADCLSSHLRRLSEEVW